MDRPEQVSFSINAVKSNKTGLFIRRRRRKRNTISFESFTKKKSPCIFETKLSPADIRQKLRVLRQEAAAGKSKDEACEGSKRSNETPEVDVIGEVATRLNETTFSSDASDSNQDSDISDELDLSPDKSSKPNNIVQSEDDLTSTSTCKPNVPSLKQHICKSILCAEDFNSLTERQRKRIDLEVHRQLLNAKTTSEDIKLSSALRNAALMVQTTDLDKHLDFNKIETLVRQFIISTKLTNLYKKGNANLFTDLVTPEVSAFLSTSEEQQLNNLIIDNIMENSEVDETGVTSRTMSKSFPTDDVQSMSDFKKFYDMLNMFVCARSAKRLKKSNYDESVKLFITKMTEDMKHLSEQILCDGSEDFSSNTTILDGCKSLQCKPSSQKCNIALFKDLVTPEVLNCLPAVHKSNLNDMVIKDVFKHAQTTTQQKDPAEEARKIIATGCVEKFVVLKTFYIKLNKYVQHTYRKKITNSKDRNCVRKQLQDMMFEQKILEMKITESFQQPFLPSRHAPKASVEDVPETQVTDHPRQAISQTMQAPKASVQTAPDMPERHQQSSSSNVQPSKDCVEPSPDTQVTEHFHQPSSSTSPTPKLTKETVSRIEHAQLSLLTSLAPRCTTETAAEAEHLQELSSPTRQSVEETGPETQTAEECQQSSPDEELVDVRRELLIATLKYDSETPSSPNRQVDFHGNSKHGRPVNMRLDYLFDGLITREVDNFLPMHYKENLNEMVIRAIMNYASKRKDLDPVKLSHQLLRTGIGINRADLVKFYRTLDNYIMKIYNKRLNPNYLRPVEIDCLRFKMRKHENDMLRHFTRVIIDEDKPASPLVTVPPAAAQSESAAAKKKRRKKKNKSAKQNEDCGQQSENKQENSENSKVKSKADRPQTNSSGNGRKISGREDFEDYLSFEAASAGLQSGELVRGVIRINPKNFKVAYVNNADSRERDYIISSLVDRNRALEGDEVVLKVKPDTEWIEGCKTAKVVYILRKVHPRTAVGRLVFTNVAYDAEFYPRDQRFPILKIPRMFWPVGFHLHPDIYADVIFCAKLTSWVKNYFPSGLLVEVFGRTGDLNAETNAILKDCGIDVSPFPQEFDRYLPQTTDLPLEELSYRLDLRDRCIFTIDPDTARDLDDAVSCRGLPNGHLEVGVHISDASYYLDEDTPLDQMVCERATTVYLVDRVHHMLPSMLCLHCSLLPARDRLAFSVLWEMTADGEVVNTTFTRSVINSCAQLSYEHAQSMIEQPDREFGPRDLPRLHHGFSAQDLSVAVNALHLLAEKMRLRRMDNGSLKIDHVKLSWQLDPATGRPLRYTSQRQLDAHRLIEEFMLLANMSVAEHIYKTYPNMAFLRCHEPPKMHMLAELQKCMEMFGIFVDTSSSKSIRTSMEKYNTDDLYGRYRSAVLNHLLTKPMMRARYYCAGDPQAGQEHKHYALSVPLYTHFTSPIRRYADIMVHRLLAASLGYTPEPAWRVDRAAAIAENCNVKKYKAKRAGEISSELYLIHYIDDHQPCIMEAVVVDVKERSYDVIVLKTGTLVRMFFNKLEPDVTVTKQSYEVKNVGLSVDDEDEEGVAVHKKKLWKHIITFPKTKQLEPVNLIIEMFSMIKISLSKVPKKLALEGRLLRPVPRPPPEPPSQFW